jgi:glucose-1-phosphatase
MPGVTTPHFLYFDLGMVLLRFSVQRMCRQMSAVAGVDPERIREVVFTGPLDHDYELGLISTRQFYENFCAQTDSRCDYDALTWAATDIFELNPSMLPVVAALRQAGYRLGVLSNTCELHWTHCVRQYRIVGDSFAVHALSYQIGAAKPDAAIFRAAAALAGVAPQEIFFVDDIAGHVAGARAVGFDAVQYTSTPELVADLRRRGLRFNY